MPHATAFLSWPSLRLRSDRAGRRRWSRDEGATHGENRRNVRGLEQVLWRVTVVMSVMMPVAWYVLASADLIDIPPPAPEHWSLLAQTAYLCGFLAALALLPWLLFYAVRWVVRALSE